MTTLVWFRQDLRLDDNAALQAAIDRGEPVIPLYVRSTEEDPWRPGEASDWWLHQSLQSLSKSLEKCGSKLILRTGHCLTELGNLVAEARASAIYWNRCYEPASISRDKTIKSKLKQQGLVAESFNSKLLFEPWEISTKDGKPYQVFTPFWRTCQSKPEPARPIPAPTHLSAPIQWPSSLPLESLLLEPTRPWINGLQEAWQPGEGGATKRLQTFLNESLGDYDTARDLPSRPGTSRLSPHLHFGEISPRTIWHAVRSVESKTRKGSAARLTAETFLKELGWREFAQHLLYHFPTTTDQPLRTEFLNFPWEDNPTALRAWQRGQTGYPIVDAGMRELWATGWIHNRVRMIVASFLVKDLRLHWRHGAAWFWDTLVDADLANNTLGWQWSAGCGADAAPYFRVFNPVLQSQKFDPDGDYLRRWIPELKSLPTKWLHAPWTATQGTLQLAGIELGKTYPAPIVDHSEARDLALKAFDQIKRS